MKNTTSSVLKIDEEGVLFKSYRDGRALKLTPESSVYSSLGTFGLISFDFHVFLAAQLVFPSESCLRKVRSISSYDLSHSDVQVQAQKKIGADIIIPLDILLPNKVDPVELKSQFDRTHRWELRSLKEHLKNPKNQVGILPFLIFALLLLLNN